MQEPESAVPPTPGGASPPGADSSAAHGAGRRARRFAWLAIPTLSLGLVGHCALKSIASAGDDLFRLGARVASGTSDDLVRSRAIPRSRLIRPGVDDVAAGTRGLAQHGLVHLEDGATTAARQAVSPNQIMWSEPLGTTSAAATASATESACQAARALVRDALVRAERMGARTAGELEAFLRELAPTHAGCAVDATSRTLRVATLVEGRTVHAAFPIRDLASTAVRLYAAGEGVTFIIDGTTIRFRPANDASVGVTQPAK